MACIERRRVLAGIAGAAAALGTASLSGRVRAQGKTISIVVPYAPGGTASDAFARMIAASMQARAVRSVSLARQHDFRGQFRAQVSPPDCRKCL